MKQKKNKIQKLKRVHRKSILFNQKEINAINHYCKRYKIKNKSKLMREFIISAILQKFDEDHPSLFDDQPNLFVSKNKNK
ncbi:MAG: hypothetical protein R6U04_08690 [Bacteroidales bacterium]